MRSSQRLKKIRVAKEPAAIRDVASAEALRPVAASCPFPQGARAPPARWGSLVCGEAGVRRLRHNCTNGHAAPLPGRPKHQTNSLGSRCNQATVARAGPQISRDMEFPASGAEWGARPVDTAG
jgi:hypothetical protein